MAKFGYVITTFDQSVVKCGYLKMGLRQRKWKNLNQNLNKKENDRHFFL